MADRRGAGRAVKVRRGSHGSAPARSSTRRGTGLPSPEAPSGGNAQRRPTGMPGAEAGKTRFVVKERRPWRLFQCFQTKSEYEKRRDERKKAWTSGGDGATRRPSKHLNWNDTLEMPPSPHEQMNRDRRAAFDRGESLDDVEGALHDATSAPPAERSSVGALWDGVRKSVRKSLLSDSPEAATAEGADGGAAGSRARDCDACAETAPPETAAAEAGALAACEDVDTEDYSCPALMSTTGGDQKFAHDGGEHATIGLLDIVCCGTNDGKHQRPTLQRALQD